MDFGVEHVHSGEPLQPGTDFFLPPPPEIGEVQSGWSSLRVDQNPMSAGARIAVLLALAVAGLGAGYVIVYLAEIDDVWQWLLPVLGVVVFAGIGALATGFRRERSYVGMDGLSQSTLRGGRTGTMQTSVLQFERAAELRVGQTRHYTNGVYTGTSYSYSWYGPAGQKLFDINGQYRNKDGPPKNLFDRYWFGPAAERAWSRHYLERCLARLGKGEPVVFRVPTGIVIELGPDYFSLQSKGNEGRWSLEDVRDLSVQQGYVYITSDKFQDSGWFSRLFGAGRISFPYNSLPNARVFLLLYDHLVKNPGARAAKG